MLKKTFSITVSTETLPHNYSSMISKLKLYIGLKIDQVDEIFSFNFIY